MRSTLKPERRARLEYLGFSFTNPKQALEDKNWNDNFDRLREHYAAAYSNHGGNPALDSKAKMDAVLNRWVSRQRRNKKDGVLSEDRQQKLESIGFRWVLVEQKRKDYTKKDLHWIQQYNSLAAFQKQFGHCNVPHGKQTPYWSLAKWVARQRELYAQKRLLDDRRELLEALGFIWSMEEKSWNENFQRLSAHVQTNQHLDFHNDSSLGRWFYAQRVRHANGNLSDDRAQLFKCLGIKFSGTRASLRTGDTDDDDDNGDNNNNNNQKPKAKPSHNSQQLLFTVDFCMKPPKGTKIRKKRFLGGWCTGEVIDTDQKDARDNRIKAKVRFEDGDEEYLSDEECRVAAIAHAIHATPPKLKVNSQQQRNAKQQQQPGMKRKRGRPPKNPTGDGAPAAKKRAASKTAAKKKAKPTTTTTGASVPLPDDSTKPQATVAETAAGQQNNGTTSEQQQARRSVDPPVLYV
ncbi:helicase [Seminavis robusta]|uniref:Helicase n=1 Tax=Seminavis robusta TaxID=568900 RepID=A0A9N8EHA6_9STRA|nr:helicase [Seminavis robusta]|eukprot:Sro1131_g244680.1 helicase (462) ;mRNA; r:24659-26246